MVYLIVIFCKSVSLSEFFFSLYFGLFWLLVIIEKEVRDRRGAEHWWRSSGRLLFRHFFLILEARFGGSDKAPKRRLNDNQ